MSATHVAAVATYLPAFEERGRRCPGPDEDAVTMAVEVGLAALKSRNIAVHRVMLVTRDLPLLQGGSGPVLTTALGLGEGVRTAEVLGGAPAVLDALADAAPGTLILAVDVEAPAGAGAILIGSDGPEVSMAARVARSLPVDVVATDGSRHAYDDPRLLRERGTRESLEAADLPALVSALAGAPLKGLDDLVASSAPALVTTGASAAVFALASILEAGDGGVIGGSEQAQLVVVDVGKGAPPITRLEFDPVLLPKRHMTGGGDMKISLPAYERAFSAKVGFAAGTCTACGTLALPPRYRCVECGHEGAHTLTPLPREGVVHTTTTVHVPVPGLATPYSLAIVELGNVGVRVLAHVTDAEPGYVEIGDSGSLVLRRVATRAGVPDYGYGFRPDRAGDR